MGEKELKLFIDDIYRIIKPKENKFTLSDIEMLVDSYYVIREDKSLYSLAIQKYQTLMNSLQYLLNDEIRIIELQDRIECNKKSEITLQVSNRLNAEELILLNYLYNLIMEAFFEEKKFTIKLYQEEKNKCLQKK